MKKILWGMIIWTIFLSLPFCNIGVKDNLAGRPDIRPIKDSAIVRIVRGFSDSHSGIDFACFIDTEVYATGDGVVIWSRHTNGYGDMMIIKHDWIKNGKAYTAYSVYGHLQEYKKLKGAVVKKGELIALSGNTGRSEGPHVHYELRNANDTAIWNGTYQAEKRIEDRVIDNEK